MKEIRVSSGDERTAEEKQREFNDKCLSEAGITYSAAALFPVLASLLIAIITVFTGQEGDWYSYLCYLLPQLCFIGALAVYFVRSKEPVKNALCGCKWYYFPLAVLLQFGLFVSLSQLNDYFVEFLTRYGYTEPAGVPLPSLGGWNLLPALLVIALMPAICEEMVFRGVLSRRMSKSGWGTIGAALLNGALFSLFHGNPSQTFYQFLCGAAFTLIALRAGSVFPTMLAHFLNNAVILVLNSVYAPQYPNGFSLADLMGKGGYIALAVVSAVCLVGAVLFLVLAGDKKVRIAKSKKFFFPALVGMIICAAEWIAILVQGFLHG